MDRQLQTTRRAIPLQQRASTTRNKQLLFRAVCVADILYGRVDLIHGGYAVAEHQQQQQE